MKISTKRGFQKNRIKMALVTLLVAPWIFACGIHYPVKGQVVDIETGKPVEGAVVAIRWLRHKLIGIPGLPAPKVNYGTFESVTDSEGRFKIPKYIIGKHFMAAYKQGYICWSSETIFNPKGKDWREMFSPRYGHRVTRNMVVKLEPKGENFPAVKHARFVGDVNTYLSSPNPLFNKFTHDEFEIEMDDIRRRMKGRIK